MITIYSKQELQRAIRNKEKDILVKGNLAKEIISKRKRQKRCKKIGITALILGGAGLALAPFTGGTSLALAGGTAITGATTMGLTATVGAAGVSISAAELVTIATFLAVGIGLLKGYDIKVNSDSSVEFHRK